MKTKSSECDLEQQENNNTTSNQVTKTNESYTNNYYIKKKVNCYNTTSESNDKYYVLTENKRFNKSNSDSTKKNNNKSYYNNKIQSLKNKLKLLINKNGELKKNINYQIETNNMNKKTIINFNTKKSEEINNIKNILQIKNNDEITSKIEYMIDFLDKRNIRIRNDLINKLNNLYIKLVGPTEEEIQNTNCYNRLWNWIKHLNTTNKSLKNNIQQKINALNDINSNINNYQLFINQIKKQDNSLINFNDINIYIEQLIISNSIQKKRSHKLHKIIFYSNDNKHLNI